MLRNARPWQPNAALVTPAGATQGFCGSHTPSHEYLFVTPSLQSSSLTPIQPLNPPSSASNNYASTYVSLLHADPVCAMALTTGTFGECGLKSSIKRTRIELCGIPG